MRIGLVLVTILSIGSFVRGGVYFKVAEIPGQEFHNDGFILPLTNASDIAHARDLISQGPAAGATIVFAEIAKGADGFNRDLNAPGEPLWNWHVTSFDGFGDFGIELLDGWPTFVEQDIDGWIANTNGKIGFWSYTVVAEVPPPPGAVPLPAGFSAGLAGLSLAFLATIFAKRRATPAAAR